MASVSMRDLKGNPDLNIIKRYSFTCVYLEMYIA